jgi:tetratricopeptide (TPR) repeat protein
MLYSAISFSRNFEWKNDLYLFRHDIVYADRSAQAQNLLGLHLMKKLSSVSDSLQRSELAKEALLHFKKSEEIYPYFFNVRYDIGRIYLALNMRDSAIEAFKYALALDTNFDEIYWNLGTQLMEEGRFEEAKQSFESVIRIIPNDYAGYERLSLLYYQMGQYDRSIGINLQAIRKFKNMPEPLINLSRTYITIHQQDSARLFLNRANELAPGNAVVQQMFTELSK